MTTTQRNKSYQRAIGAPHMPFKKKAVAAALCSALAMSAVANTSAWAAPTGGTVVQGSGAISSPDAQTTQIIQSSDKLIVNWQGFGIGANERVGFTQPSSTSVALNRVTGADPSVLLGQLTANGQIFLINPNGVVFGQGAVVDVAGLVASTLDIADSDFMGGRYVFVAGEGSGSVVNQGTIRTTDGGYIVLAGSQVQNEGVLEARLGTVALGAGKQVTLDFAGDGLLHFAVDGAAVAANVANKGLIQADGGRVFLTARAAGDLIGTIVNNEGIIEARSLVNRGGVIRLEASDPVNNNGVLGWQENLGKVTNAAGGIHNSGTLDVSAAEAGAAQGQVTLAGQYVTHSGQILAQGADDAQGGRVLLSSTDRTVIAETGLIDTSGVGNASAGNVVIWSDKDTYFKGTLLGKGGAAGGDGANAEISGYDYLEYVGNVDLTAPKGMLGTLLLDPASIEIVGGGAQAGDDCLNLDLGTAADCTGAITSSVGHMGVTEAGGAGAATKISEDKIEATDANIHLTAAKTIFVSGTFAGGDLALKVNRNLTLETRNAVDEAGGIDLTGVAVAIKTSGTGTITITAGTDGAATTYAKLGPMSTENQNITVTSKNGLISTAGAINAGTGTVSLTTAEAAEATDAKISLGADVSGALIKLTSVDGIEQPAGKLTATDLVVRAAKTDAATVGLNSATNNVANLAATNIDAAMTFGYTDANALTVATVDAVDGITSGNANVTLDTVDGALTVSKLINAGTGTVSLTTAEAAEATVADINYAANINGATVKLNSADGIDDGAAGSITATDLIVRAGGGTADAAAILDNGANNVTVLAATNTGTGVLSFNYTDADNLTITALDGIDGIKTNGDVTVTSAAGTLYLDKVAGNNISLTANQSILDINDPPAATINVTAQAAAMFKATKGTVGTNTNGIEVNSKGKLSLYAGGQVGLVSGNINGIVAGNVIHPLNVAPGLLLLNGKVVGGGLMDAVNAGRFGIQIQIPQMDGLLVPRPIAYNMSRYYPTDSVAEEMAFVPAAPLALSQLWNAVDSGTYLPEGVSVNWVPQPAEK